MIEKEIQIPRPLAIELLHHAQISQDREVCGLIGAHQGTPVSCYPITNVADNPSELFELDPKEQVNAMRKMRERSEELFGIFHSHPTTDATPSVTDLELAEYPDVVYLIISLKTKGVLQMRGFYLSDHNNFKEIRLLLKSD